MKVPKLNTDNLTKSFFKKSNKLPSIIFVFIFLLNVMTGVLVIKQNFSSEHDFKELKGENFEGMVHLTHATSALWELHNSLSDYALANFELRHKIKEIFPTQLQSVQTNIVKCIEKMTYPDEKLILSNFEKEFSEYLKFRPQYFNLIDENKVKEAHIFRLQFLDQFAQKSIGHLKEIIEAQKTEARKRSDDVTLQVRKTRNFMYLFLVIEILLCAGLFYSLARSQREAELNFQISSHSLKMAALGEMSGSIAHEINNPLTIIKGKSAQTLKYIQKNDSQPQVIVDNLEKIIGMTDRISKIVRGMKSIARNVDNDPYISVPLAAINENIQSICFEKFKNAEIILDIGKIPEIHIACRASEIEQVIFNLLNNAFDAVASLPDKWVRIDYITTPERLQISVTDSGHGIPEEIVKKLMLPFFTTKEVGLGTGLGLSISKSIIENHKGRLYYDSKCPNTRFVIDIPIKE